MKILLFCKKKQLYYLTYEEIIGNQITKRSLFSRMGSYYKINKMEAMARVAKFWESGRPNQGIKSKINKWKTPFQYHH
jgi:hypothetical protein